MKKLEPKAPGQWRRGVERWFSPLAFVLALATGVVVVSPPEAQEDPNGTPRVITRDEAEERIRSAEQFWSFGDYTAVVNMLRPLLFPEPTEALDDDQIADVWGSYGAAMLVTGERQAGHDALLQALLIDPDYSLDPFVYPPSITRQVDVVRNAPENQAALEEARRLRLSPNEGGSIRFVAARYEVRSPVMSIIPFGVGHFINDQPEWGVTYLTVELALAASSAALYFVNRSQIGDDDFVDDAAVVRESELREQWQIGLGVSFLLVLTVNMVHGALIHDDEGTVSYEILDEPPEGFFEGTSFSPFFAPTAWGEWYVGIDGVW